MLLDPPAALIAHTTAGLGMLAHQGGWDEIGLVVLPIVIFAALLWMANRRANSLAEDALEEQPDPEPGTGPGADAEAPVRGDAAPSTRPRRRRPGPGASR
ncbi:MAG: hypothetical protein WKF43_08595 [Acidimicrobiales bacterium]